MQKQKHTGMTNKKLDKKLGKRLSSDEAFRAPSLSNLIYLAFYCKTLV